MCCDEALQLTVTATVFMTMINVQLMHISTYDYQRKNSEKIEEYSHKVFVISV